MINSNNRLINDVEIAQLVSLSRSWVRKQRWSRRHGLPHAFDIDPVMIGSVPRYRFRDVLTWIESRGPEIARAGGEQ